MSSIDKNKIFFGLLHYVFSEQKNVDWALKSSLVNFTGITSTIGEEKYAREDLTDSVISYIKDVKPYHVQFEQFIEKYSNKKETVNVLASDTLDAEINVRFDAVSTKPDIEWYNNIDENDSKEVLKYLNSHMSNRLYFYKTKDLNVINDYLNGHFKGIELDGSKFNLGRNGYDSSLYESGLYDSPTIVSEYCLVHIDDKIPYPHIKKFISVGEKTLELQDNNIKAFDKSNLKITSSLNNEIKEITDYSIENNIITFFYPLRAYETINVLYQTQTYKKSFIFVAHPFQENADENTTKEFITHTSRMFKLPGSQDISSVYSVYIESPKGTRTKVKDYIIEDGYLYLNDDPTSDSASLDDNWKVIITALDYAYIYDKIYTWEDQYGRSNKSVLWENSGLKLNRKDKEDLVWKDIYDNYNNIQRIDGFDMERPDYEKDRPSELTVSEPTTHLMITRYNKNGKLVNIYDVDYANNQNIVLSNNETTLQQELLYDDDEIIIQDGEKVLEPYYENNYLHCGYLLIDNEYIAYHDVIRNDDGSCKCLKLVRGWNGSYIKEKYNEGTKVLCMNKEYQTKVKIDQTSMSYFVKDNNEYIIPGHIELVHELDTKIENDKVILDSKIITNKIEVYKKHHIKLLSDILFESEYFDIDSNNIVLPTNRNRGWLLINDDKIYFDKIEKLSDAQYRISNFNIDKEYYKDKSEIISSNFVKIDNYKICKEKYYTKELAEETLDGNDAEQNYFKYKYYIDFEELPLKNEIITIINRSR